MYVIYTVLDNFLVQNDNLVHVLLPNKTQYANIHS